MKIQIIIFLLIIILILSICLIVFTSINLYHHHVLKHDNVLKHGGGINELRDEIAKLRLYHTNEIQKIKELYDTQQLKFERLVGNYIKDIQESAIIDDSIKQQLVENIYKVLNKSKDYDDDDTMGDDVVMSDDEDVADKYNRMNRILAIQQHINKSLSPDFVNKLKLGDKVISDDKTIGNDNNLDELNRIFRDLETPKLNNSKLGGGLLSSQIQPLIKLVNTHLRNQNSDIFKSHDLISILNNLLNEQFFIDAKSEFDKLQSENRQQSENIYEYIKVKIKNYILSLPQISADSITFTPNRVEFKSNIDNIYKIMSLSDIELLKELELLQKEIGEQNKLLSNSLTDIENAENKIVELTSQLQLVANAYSDLQKQKDILQDTYSALEAKQVALSKDNYELSDELHTLKNKFTQMNDPKNVTIMHRALSSLEEEKENLYTELKFKNAKIEELYKRISGLSTTIREKNNEISKYGPMVQEYVPKINAQSAVLAHIKAENKHLSLENTSLKATQSNNIRERTHWANMIKQCEDSKFSMDSDLMETNRKLKLEIQTLNNNIDEITNELKKLYNNHI